MNIHNNIISHIIFIPEKKKNFVLQIKNFKINQQRQISLA